MLNFLDCSNRENYLWTETMKEAVVNREDGASMVGQSCRWSRALGFLGRVQLLRDLIKCPEI